MVNYFKCNESQYSVLKKKHQLNYYFIKNIVITSQCKYKLQYKVLMQANVSMDIEDKEDH